MPLITISMPCRNAASTLLLALKSIFAQTFKDWELIIVNDGSTDDTAAILNSLDDPRVRVVHHAKAAGLATRLNEAADLAQAPYIARMDGDDIMFPDRLARQLDVLLSHEHFNLVGSAAVVINQIESIRGIRFPPETVTDPRRFFHGGVLYHPTVMGRTEWFRHNRYDPSFMISQDFELWTRSTPHLQIFNLQKPTLFYRDVDDGLTSKYWRSSRQGRRVIRLHGPSRIGHLQTQLLVLRRLAKDAVYWVLTKLNLRETALGLRNKKLSDEEIAKYTAILDQIRAVPLPVKSGHLEKQSHREQPLL